MKLQNYILITSLSILVSACKGVPVKYAPDEILPVSQADQAADSAESGKRLTKVCKMDAPTGSRIGRKICRTAEAWDEIERKAQRQLDNMTKPQSHNREGV